MLTHTYFGSLQDALGMLALHACCINASRMPTLTTRPTLTYLILTAVCRCLEVGCGSGYVICSVALALQQLYSSNPSTGSAPEAAEAAGQRGKAWASLPPWRFVATDINPAALGATTATLEAHGVRRLCAGQAGRVVLLQQDVVWWSSGAGLRIQHGASAA